MRRRKRSAVGRCLLEISAVQTAAFDPIAMAVKLSLVNLN